MSVYFGGSRHNQAFQNLPQVVAAVIASGHAVHVGCQFGADQQVIKSAPYSSLFVFAVAPTLAQSPAHVQQAAQAGASVTLSAGGNGASISARYLLRSMAGFKGCNQAVFFSPGSGSLAVARECVRSGLQVFAFQVAQPSPIPSCRGQWCLSWFRGFQCWAWGKLSNQLSLF